MHSIQIFIESYSGYKTALRKIVNNTKCIFLKQKAEDILQNSNIQPHSDEDLIKEIKEEIADYERNYFY